MDKFSMENSPKTPRVDFDPNTGIFNISGHSYPENATAYYKPLFTWLSKYIDSPCDATKVSFRMEYFNSSSAACLFDIIDRLKDIQENNPSKSVDVYWYYEEDDQDMKEAGSSFNALLIDFKIQLIPFNDPT